ncbi:MAG: DALR anticodon-binding domain-containing protein, partial [Chthoniobacterales bacterium]
FYEACPVLKSEGDILKSRLTLCRTTARILATGLDLLGIQVPEKM